MLSKWTASRTLQYSRIQYSAVQYRSHISTLVMQTEEEGTTAVKEGEILQPGEIMVDRFKQRNKEDKMGMTGHTKDSCNAAKKYSRT